MTPEAVDSYFLEEGIASAAVERYYLEQKYRKLWLQYKSKAARKLRKNRQLPFARFMRALRDLGVITATEASTLSNKYNRLSKLFHLTRPEEVDVHAATITRPAAASTVEAEATEDWVDLLV